MRNSRLHRFWPAVFRRLGLARRLNYDHPLTISGRAFSIPIAGGIGEDLLKLTPDFKSEIIRLFGDRIPNCFVDVGANLGQTVIEAFATRRWDRYFAVEPNPTACAYLESLVKANHLPVDVLPWGAGADASPHSFCFQGTTDASATMAPEERPGAYSPEMSRSVATYPLDVLLDIFPLPPGLMIKIDVEGFEAEVLAGARNILSDVRPVILCEVLRAYEPASLTFTEKRMSKLEAILAAVDYRIFYLELENEVSGRILSMKEIASFPRALWRESPSGMDYLFVPAEMTLPDFLAG
ncbi:MAG TPA: FkbM family methyltransferase [Rhizomicrobium sp.]